MIVSRAPLRLGLAGGGTDVEPYVTDFGGEVLNVTLNKFVFTQISESTSSKLCLYDGSSDSEVTYSVAELPVEDDSLMLCIYRYMFDKYRDKVYQPLNIRTYSEVPFGSGLGGSSTATVSILKGLFLYFGVEVDDYELAGEAFHIERNVFGLSGGAQDQYAAVFGGVNHLQFRADSVIVNSLRVRNSIMLSLESKLMLYYTGKSRASGQIIDSQIVNQKKSDSLTLEALHRVRKNVAPMQEALLKGDFETLYRVINSGWEDKKKLSSQISSTSIDTTYDRIMAAGGFGGKISGAGGGGFMWFLAPLDKHRDIELALKDSPGYFLDCKFCDLGAEAWFEV
jgi:D-glycero-alpha-D-manno-heptose-7-phosphate kinase